MLAKAAEGIKKGISNRRAANPKTDEHTGQNGATQASTTKPQVTKEGDTAVISNLLLDPTLNGHVRVIEDWQPHKEPWRVHDTTNDNYYNIKPINLKRTARPTTAGNSDQLPPQSPPIDPGPNGPHAPRAVQRDHLSNTTIGTTVSQPPCGT